MEPMTDNTETINEREYRLQSSGGGDGTALHIDSDRARRLSLSENTEITVRLVNNDGNPELHLVDLPTGISEEDFLSHAEERGWEHVISNEDVIKGGEPDHWGHTFVADEEIRVKASGFTHVGSDICNNVFISAPPVSLDDIETYRQFRDIASENPRLFFQIHDNEGIWQRLKASVEHEVEDPPTEETIQQLIDKVEEVNITFEAVASSLLITLDELDELVDAVSAASSSV